MPASKNIATKKVTLVIDTLFRAGAQLQASMLAGELAKKGVLVTVLLLEHPENEPAPEIHGVSILSIPVGPLNKLETIKQLFVLVRMLKGLCPDVVHTFLFKANLVGALAARLAGVPVVVGSRRSLGYDMNSRRNMLARLFNNITDATVVNARCIIPRTKENEGADLPCPVVIPNGVQLQKSSGVRNDDGVPVIGVLANIRPVKGHDTLLQAFNLVLKKIPDAKLHLMGCRNGDPAWSRTIMSMIESMRLNDRIVWHDPQQEVNKFFQGIDVFVSSSRSEGLSNSILEAMASGVSVVATDVGGTSEALGETGVLVPSEDPEALSMAIVNHFENKEQSKSRAESALLRTKTKFDPQALAKLHISFYSWLVETATYKKFNPFWRRPRRRVVIAIDLLDTGGTENQVKQWALGLQKEGISTTVVCLREGGRIANELVDAGIDVRILGKRHRFDPLFLVRQQLLFWKLRPLTVLPLLTTAGIWSIPAARLAAVPNVVFSMRSTALTDDPDLTGPIRLLRFVLRLAHSVVGNSPEVLSFCRKQLNVSKRKTAFLPNAISNKGLRNIPRNDLRQKFGLPEKGPLFGIVARLVPIKDHELFLDVCEKMKRLCPSARALVIGDGPSGQWLKDEIVRRDLEDMVKMLGYRTDVMELVRSMDAMVLTSHSEGSPNVVLEAMAVGTPVVSVNVGDVARMIGQKGGNVINSRDPNEFAQALNYCLDTTQNNSELRSWAQCDFNNVIELLRNLVSRGSIEGPLGYGEVR